jgi:hypothetical protein
LAIVTELDFQNDELSCVRLSDGKKLIFYASPDYPVFHKKQIEWQDICQFTLISGDATYVQQKIIDKLLKEGINTPLKINMTSIEDEVKAGSLKIISLPDDLYIKIDAIFNKSFTKSPLIQQFINCAKTILHNREKIVPNDLPSTKNSITLN